MNSILSDRNFSPREVLLLKLLVFCLFAGRAWQGLFWDLPLRAFFWDQWLLEGLVTTLTGDTWQNYVTNRSVDIDSWINCLGVFMGLFWLLCALLSLMIKKEWKWAKRILQLASFSLFLLSLLYFKEKFLAWGQLFEYSIQIAAPLILVHAIYGGLNTARFRLVLKVVIATAFVCHGLFACGYYPLPGLWVYWCMDVFRLSTDMQAVHFLTFIGILDFLAAVCLFFSFTFRYAVWYCIVWGTLTALARVVGNFYINMPLESLHQSAYEMFYRLVHGGIPLLLWSCSSKRVAAQSNVL